MIPMSTFLSSCLLAAVFGYTHAEIEEPQCSATDHTKWEINLEGRHVPKIYACADADAVSMLKCLRQSSISGYSKKCIYCMAEISACSKSMCKSECDRTKWSTKNLKHWTQCAICVHDSKCEELFLLCSGLEDISRDPLPVYGASHCNDSDGRIWKKSGYSHYNKEISECGHKCWAKRDCVTDCIEEKEHYSRPCGTCFGDVAACSRSECFSHCIWGETQACKDCVKQYCVPAFETCTGFQVPPSVKSDTNDKSDENSDKIDTMEVEYLE